jgi:hypothetical protein
MVHRSVFSSPQVGFLNPQMMPARAYHGGWPVTGQSQKCTRVRGKPVTCRSCLCETDCGALLAANAILTLEEWKCFLEYSVQKKKFLFPEKVCGIILHGGWCGQTSTLVVCVPALTQSGQEAKSKRREGKGQILRGQRRRSAGTLLATHASVKSLEVR